MSEREWETDPRPSGLVGPATRSHVQSVLFLFVNMIKEYWRGEESRHSLLFFYLFHLNVIKLFSKEEKIKRLQSFHCVTRVSIFCFSVRKYKKTPNNKFTETNDKRQTGLRSEFSPEMKSPVHWGQFKLYWLKIQRFENCCWFVAEMNFIFNTRWNVLIRWEIIWTL